MNFNVFEKLYICTLSVPVCLFLNFNNFLPVLWTELFASSEYMYSYTLLVVRHSLGSQFNNVAVIYACDLSPIFYWACISTKRGVSRST